MLHLEDEQIEAVENCYLTASRYQPIFAEDASSQDVASSLLRDQGINLNDMGDLGNGWSKR